MWKTLEWLTINIGTFIINIIIEQLFLDNEQRKKTFKEQNNSTLL